MSGLNICLISREFPPDTAFGGIATFSVDTALMLRKRGHRVTVFSQCLSKSHVADYQGVPVHKIKVPRPLETYKRLPVFIPAFNAVLHKEIRRCHRADPFDLIDAPDHLAEGLFTALFSKLPLVTRLHTPYALIVAMGLNNYRKDLSYRAIYAMEKAQLRRSAVLYAPCQDLVKRCEALFGLKDSPVSIFGYPLDLQMFSPAPAPNDTFPSRILFLGRLEQRKGIKTIVEAFPKLLERNPGAELTLVGRDTPNIDGWASAKAYMMDAFERAGCADKVHFKDYVPLDQLPAFFHSHDVVWVPSMYDNFPIISLEAMACGKAVVVADSGGLPEMVTHGETGLVFPAGDADALAQQTMILFDSPDLFRRIGANARRYAEENCSEGAIYAKTMAMYQKAISRAKGISGDR
jgi:glycogen(starch) synthase